METIDCIKKRRSKRLFLDKEIPENIINTILECGINAPSSMDCQPWHFVLVKDKNIINQLAELKEDENRGHILSAPLTIVVCVDIEKSPTRFLEDGVTATENILLGVHDLGLGSVYTGYAPKNSEIKSAIKNILNLPENVIPITVLPIGYPDPNEDIKPKNLIDLKNLIHHDKW